ncbi:MAG TPA: dihydroneopterin aldolase [Phycisphaerae bacterium]|nr:dihydroneopterin aldolase [Phycisphaerae bacterium]
MADRTAGPEGIHLRDLRARCIIGTLPHERQTPQEVVLNIVLRADLSAACRSDRLEDTVDYARIEREVVAAVEASSFFLLERLAEQVARVCLAPERVDSVRVTVDKPGALPACRSVAIEIVRGR